MVGSTQCESRVSELESALEEKELELQTLLGLVAENATLSTDVARFRASVETLGREKRKLVVPTYDVRALTKNVGKIKAIAEKLRRRIVKLEDDVLNKRTLATMETARVNELAHESASVRSKLSASRVKVANSRRSAHSVAKNASKVKENVSNAFMAVSGGMLTGLIGRFLSLGWN